MFCDTVPFLLHPQGGCEKPTAKILNQFEIVLRKQNAVALGKEFEQFANPIPIDNDRLRTAFVSLRCCFLKTLNEIALRTLVLFGLFCL